MAKRNRKKKTALDAASRLETWQRRPLFELQEHCDSAGKGAYMGVNWLIKKHSAGTTFGAAGGKGGP